MTLELLIEYAFKGLISGGVLLMIWILKDFKTSLTKLTDSLAAMALSLRELIVKDENKSESMGEMKERITKLETEVGRLQLQVARLQSKKE